MTNNNNRVAWAPRARKYRLGRGLDAIFCRLSSIAATLIFTEHAGRRGTLLELIWRALVFPHLGIESDRRLAPGFGRGVFLPHSTGDSS
jgi:hypothetical protein